MQPSSPWVHEEPLLALHDVAHRAEPRTKVHPPRTISRMVAMLALEALVDNPRKTSCLRRNTPNPVAPCPVSVA